MNSSPIVPPCATYELNAHSKSPMAPSLRSFAFCETSSVPAGIRLAGCTERGFFRVSHAIAAATATVIQIVARAFLFIEAILVAPNCWLKGTVTNQDSRSRPTERAEGSLSDRTGRNFRRDCHPGKRPPGRAPDTWSTGAGSFPTALPPRG